MLIKRVLCKKRHLAGAVKMQLIVDLIDFVVVIVGRYVLRFVITLLFGSSIFGFSKINLRAARIAMYVTVLTRFTIDALNRYSSSISKYHNGKINSLFYFLFHF